MPTDTTAQPLLPAWCAESRLSRRAAVAVLAMGSLAPAWVHGQSKPIPVPGEVTTELGAEVRLQGMTRLRMLGLHIYDARLWVTPAFDAQRFDRSALALELIYARSLKGPAIAQRSLDEMRRGGPVAEPDGQRWLGFMREAFPDVSADDRLCGIWQPQQNRSVFYVNGSAGRALTDPQFGPRFFGIWLAEHSSQPDLRRALLGGSKAS